MEATKIAINQAADALRKKIDDIWQEEADLFGESRANKATDYLYNSVTLLHEQAMKAVS